MVQRMAHGLRLIWIDCHGNSKKFSVSQVWDDIRMRDSKVKWRKLKTQDLIPAWDVSANLGVVCSLCETVPDSHDHMSKVAWEIVCLLKDEGGLGIRRLECFNSALMAAHVWKLLTLKKSLWRKILKLRPSIRRFIWSKIGNGLNTSLWYDKWNDLDHIASIVSPRDIARAGLSLQAKVSDVITQGTWVWPAELIAKYPTLDNYIVPINNDLDRLIWIDCHGNSKKFSVSQVWDDIRMRDSKVKWYSMVWFPSCIPRHAIHLWLIIRRKLKTQDLIPAWDVSANLGVVCSLCETVPDSHDHMFFECSFSRGIWTNQLADDESKSVERLARLRISPDAFCLDLMLVLSCCVIFDLEPFHFDFDCNSEIFKSFPCLSCCLCHLAILCLDQHAYTMQHLERLLTISLNNRCLDNLDNF
ncbi:putative reverse transcriptase domain, reverse transcriptase zinc-binding domain protein [Tanacetum coccineum]|uniref:Reverse transcriptase domain, reverse transcriptase zinc-binding domain protein n=1 Tax=Tanacetum coccineum TaxID=301880 RepID=A0ABQ4YHN5_9ASTR